MGIIQENRLNAPQPEVKDTDYGARYVKAATETPVSEIPPAKEEELEVEPVPAAKDGDISEDIAIIGAARGGSALLTELDGGAVSVGMSKITTATTQKEKKPRKKGRKTKKES